MTRCRLCGCADVSLPAEKIAREHEQAKAVAWYAFVDGAEWWEFESCHATMWPSDQDLVRAAAERRYPYVPHGAVRVAQIERDRAIEALRRVSDCAALANELQHAGIKCPASVWAELYQATNGARSLLAEIDGGKEGPCTT